MYRLGDVHVVSYNPRDPIRFLVACVNKQNKFNFKFKVGQKTPSSTQNGSSFHRVIRPFRVPNKQQKFSYFGLPQNKLYNLIKVTTQFEIN